MKLVVAVIRQEKFADVKDALAAFGTQGMTVSNVHGYGRQRGHSEVYRGAEYSVDLLEKTRLELVVADQQAHEVVDAIAAAATTGRAGDGKVWVTPVEEVVRLRTGERGESAV